MKKLKAVLGLVTALAVATPAMSAFAQAHQYNGPRYEQYHDSRYHNGDRYQEQRDFRNDRWDSRRGYENRWDQRQFERYRSSDRNRVNGTVFATLAGIALGVAITDARSGERRQYYQDRRTHRYYYYDYNRRAYYWDPGFRPYQHW